MSDIFQEVDEDLRREEYGRLWNRYGAYVIAGGLAIILGSAGMVGWRTYQHHLRQEASLKYQAIVHSGEADAPSLDTDTAKALAGIQPSLTHGYRILARLERAGVLVDAKQYGDAIALLDGVAKDSSAPKELRDIATLKSAYLQAESLSLADMRTRLADLAQPESALRFSANELLAYVALRTGDYTSARDYAQAILADPAAPPRLHQRALDLAGLIAGHLPETDTPPANQSSDSKAAPPAAPASTSH